MTASELVLERIWQRPRRTPIDPIGTRSPGPEAKLVTTKQATYDAYGGEQTEKDDPKDDRADDPTE
jgi:hypothetical protein